MKEADRMELDAVKLRRKARDFANKTVKSQKAQFQRYSSFHHLMPCPFCDSFNLHLKIARK